MTLDEKIQAILRHSEKRWQAMSKDQLIEQLWTEFHYYLDNEIDQGNQEYIDELYEEITE